MTTNVITEVMPGATSASASCYAVVFQSVEDFPLQPVIGVRYYDKFARSEQGWRFEERKIESHLLGDLSRHLLQPL